jgi:transposase InsO family protein
MPWKEWDTMSLRREFVELASREEANRRALCRRFGISATTGYKWLRRFAEEGRDGLVDRSRRPVMSPARTREAVERRVVSVRRRHPSWGGRKIRRWLLDHGVEQAPAASTITGILGRHGLLDEQLRSRRPWQRFEAARPNALWQMDFKGDYLLGSGRCYPLTVLDDHSRFSLGLSACANQRWTTVRGRLEGIFRCYGLPERLLMDNGAPWGARGQKGLELTRLEVWLVRLGIGVVHSRPSHPQTLGKDERFHRTLKAEVLSRGAPPDLQAQQRAFDRWREIYNFERPHEALGLEVPARRYQPSPREFPATLPPITYPSSLSVRKVGAQGKISFRGRSFRISKALVGLPVALKPGLQDGRYDVLLGPHPLTTIDLVEPSA